jgi:hypothetical protein
MCKTTPPPPGGTAILPEYIHYYGYYYQVQCLSTKITFTDIYNDLQRLYSVYGDDLSHHKFTATVSYRMYVVTETNSLREYHFVLQTVAYNRVIELQWPTFA